MLQIRKILTPFLPPDKWKVPLIIVLGLIAGLALYNFYISRAWSYISDDPSTCINCHVMTTQYVTWRQSSHRENATCNDCHVPQDNIFRTYYFKAMDGMRHSAIFTARTYEQSIRMRAPGNTVVQENCIRCHGTLTEMVKANITYKESKSGQGKKCWDCHRDVPHGNIRSLTTTPWSEVPAPKNPVPDWLKK
ncbi:MAG: cytochrome c nitrite reductase small subunit [Bacteroidales bacterium]|nr:cytochrome c nitrite reductase small subunit [Bacteroidales bacterium]